MTPYDNMPLLSLFALHALSAVDKSKSPIEKAEEAFEIAKYMESYHNMNKPTPGVMRKAGELPRKKE